MSSPTYTPALSFKPLTRLYDFVLAATFPEKKIKQALIDKMQLKGSETILDFGCGTGTLAIMIKEQFPSVTVRGLDVDEKVLAIAEKKIHSKKLDIQLQRYDGETLPLSHQHFDKIVSTLAFHHIPTAGKRKILPQLYRLIKPGGEIFVADFGRPVNFYQKLAFGLLRRFDGIDNTQVNAEGRLPDFIRAGGFNNVELVTSYKTIFGSIDLIAGKDTEAQLRKIEFAKHQNEHLRLWATNLRDIVWDTIAQKLEDRNSTLSHLPSDNDIFSPFIDAYAAGNIIHPMSSYFADLGKRIYRDVVVEYESDYSVQVNKEYLFVAISFLSIQAGDEVTAMLYWELAQKERETTYGTTASLDNTINMLHSKFRNIIGAIDRTYNGNKLISILKPKFPFIQDFETTLKSLNNLSKAHFLSCGIKHVHLLGKLRAHGDIGIIKVFAQELLNSLCILNENLLKEKGLSGSTINPLMISVYTTYPAVGHYLGQSSASTGIYALGKANFYARLNDYIGFLETNISDADKLKADVLYALHQLRNEALHTLDDTRLYYTDAELFEKTIGLLFICVSVIKSL